MSGAGYDSDLWHESIAALDAYELERDNITEETEAACLDMSPIIKGTANAASRTIPRVVSKIVEGAMPAIKSMDL